MNNITTYELSNKTSVYYIETSRFKTINFTVNLSVPLSRPDVTYNALIPAILRRGCNKFPNTKLLNTYLDDLYGANFTYNVKKCGNLQIISFNFNIINDKYLNNFEISKKILELAENVLFDPLIEDNGFKEEFVTREKDNLKQYIESIINDKREYAKLRLVSEMYKNESYGIFPNGYVEDLDDINGKDLYKHYKNLLKNADIQIFITGQVDKNLYDTFIKTHFSYEKNTLNIENTDFGKYSDRVKYIDESNDINQGKLSIGFRTNGTIDTDLYFPMLLLNNLYGGSVHSKLFLNVREKMSLAYYASSEYDSFKGFINVNSGIQFENYKVALDEILNQLEDVKSGNFTDKDIEFSKLSMITKYEGINDSAYGMENFYAAQLIAHKNFSVEDMIENINKVTKEDIINASKTIKLDTVFFLKGSENVEL